MLRVIMVLIAMSSLTGCASTIESFYNRQVVEDQLIQKNDGRQELGTLAVTAQRRIVIANLKTGNFCSEPPPETADSITTAIATALQANISADQNVNAELASNFARHVNQLYKRSHTVQLFRDVSYHLCVDAVNTANKTEKIIDTNKNTETITSNQYEPYKSSLVEILKVLVPSLDKEVALYYQTEQARAENPPEKKQDMIVCDSEASINPETEDGMQKISTSINCRPLNTIEKAEDNKKGTTTENKGKE